MEIKELLDGFLKYITPADIETAKILSDMSLEIIEFRFRNKMSRKQFADFMGVSPRMVSKWENDNYDFTISSLIKICEKLNLSLDIKIKKCETEIND